MLASVKFLEYILSKTLLILLFEYPIPDVVVMLLTNTDTIRDVLLFPHMKPNKKD